MCDDQGYPLREAPQHADSGNSLSTGDFARKWNINILFLK